MSAGRIHVLHVITGLGLGGAERTLTAVAAGLDPGVFRSTVVSLTSRGPFADELEGAGVEVIALGLSSRGLPLTGVTKLARILRERDPDIIQTWMYHSDLLGQLAALAARRGPVSWNVRASSRTVSDVGLKTWVTMRACAALSRLPDVVVVNSQIGSRDHERIGYRPRRWKLIHNGVDTRAFRPREEAHGWLREQLGIDRSAVVAGQAARFHRMKGHPILLQSVAELLREFETLHLLMIGQQVTADNPELSRWLPEQAIRERIHLIGPQTDLAKWLAGLDFHMLASSTGEGFPNVVAEAMACGVPNVVTDVGEAGFIVGSTGVVVPPNQASALAAGIRRMLEMGSEGRAARGSQARARVVRLFSLERMLAEYSALYQDLVA